MPAHSSLLLDALGINASTARAKPPAKDRRLLPLLELCQDVEVRLSSTHTRDCERRKAVQSFRFVDAMKAHSHHGLGLHQHYESSALLVVFCSFLSDAKLCKPTTITTATDKLQINDNGRGKIQKKVGAFGGGEMG